VTAATAANGALKGERAAMVAGLKSVASAHSAKAGAQVQLNKDLMICELGSTQWL